LARARRKWIREQDLLDPAKLVFIDETSVNTNMVRLYGRCPCGVRLVDHVPFGQWETMTFVSALRHDGMVAPMLIEGPMNGELFLAYVEQCLAPTLKLSRGIFIHRPIAATPKVRGEVAIGWAFHYAVGVAYAALYLAIMRLAFDAEPTFVSALVFAIALLIAPWFVMQPALGIGFMAARTPNPAAVRLINVSVHAVFGLASISVPSPPRSWAPRCNGFSPRQVNSVRKEAIARARQAEMFAERRPFIVAPKQATTL
jgi:hypothetical protein